MKEGEKPDAGGDKTEKEREKESVREREYNKEGSAEKLKGASVGRS